MSALFPIRKSDIQFWLLGIPLWLLAASLIGLGVHFFRPDSARLPWISDWAHHIETKAQEVGISTVQLLRVRDILAEADWLIFDARTSGQYTEGHIPGAYSLPVSDMPAVLADYMEMLEPHTPILIYCDGFECSDSLELALQLQSLGYSNLALYPGGYAQWVEYGGDILTGSEGL